MSAAPRAHMTRRIALHMTQRHQRRAIHRNRPASLFALRVRALPGAGGDFKVNRGQFCKQGKYAVHRTEIFTPNPFFPSVEISGRNGGNGRTAQNQQYRFGILIDADHLAVDRRDRKRDKRPAAPAHPARNGTATTVPAGEFRERAFRTQDAAPDAPEYPLSKDSQMIPHMFGVARQRHKRWRGDEDGVEADDDPLHGANGGAMAAHPVPNPRQSLFQWLARRRFALAVLFILSSHSLLVQSF